RPAPCSSLFPYTTLFRSVSPVFDAVSSDCLGNFAQQSGAAINQAGVNLQELSAGPNLFTRRIGIHNSAGRDDWNCRSCGDPSDRSEEHTSELQSPCNLVC